MSFVACERTQLVQRAAETQAMRVFVWLSGVVFVCLTACSEPSAPVELRAVVPLRVGAPFERVASSFVPAAKRTHEAERPNDELVFRSAAAYDLSGWSPPPLPRRRARESYTASDYDYHYADVPGHPGVREATNGVTVVLAEGVGRDVILQILEAEEAEIVGQLPDLRFYQLRIPARSFDEGMATAARIRATAGVQIAAYSPSSYFGVDDGEAHD